MKNSPETIQPKHGRLLVGIAIVLLAINLRSAVASVGVVLDALTADLGMSLTVAGLLTTMPVVCFSIFGGGSHRIVRAIGLHRSAALLLLLTATGMALRAIVDSGAAFIALSILSLASCAVGNVILPPLAKVHFPDRIPFISALYGAALMASGALSATITVPVSDAFGSWRAGIGMWSLLAVAALIPWLFYSRKDVHVDPNASTRLSFKDLLRSPLAWAFALTFGAQSAQAYAQFGWFPKILNDAGLSEAQAGSMQGLIAIVGIPLTFTLPTMIRRAGDLPILPWVFAISSLAGWIGVLFLPATVTWLWAALLGLGGCAFTWTLTMFGHRTHTPDSTAALSSFAQGIGYFIAALGPFGTGFLHELSGSWTLPIVALALFSIPTIVFGTFVNRPVYLEETLRPIASSPTL